MRHTRTPIRAILLAGAFAGATIVASSIATTAVAQSGGFSHFIACAGWLIVDPEMHAENCLPSRNAPSTESPSTSGPGTAGDDTFDGYPDGDDDGIYCDSVICDNEG